MLFKLQNTPALGPWRAEKCYRYIYMREQAFSVLSKSFCSLLAAAVRFVQSLLSGGCSSMLFAHGKQVACHPSKVLSDHLFIVLLNNIGIGLMYLHF